MDYRKIYRQLVDRAIYQNRQKGLGIYYEKHHISPKCLGGTDENENLVLLTAREHFIAHWLLVKIYPDNYKIIYAFNSFCLTSRGYRPVSRNYKYAKELHINAIKNDLEVRKKNSESLKKLIWMIDPSGKNIRIDKKLVDKFLKVGCVRGRVIKSRKKASQETKNKISKANKGRLPPESARINAAAKIKGKTYEQIYGQEKALELKEIRRQQKYKENREKLNIL